MTHDWSTLIAEVLTRDSRLGALLFEAEPVLFDPPRIAVAIARPFDAERARERIADLQALMADILGAPVRLSVLTGRVP